jgi:hypothetical protein
MLLLPIIHVWVCVVGRKSTHVFGSSKVENVLGKNSISKNIYGNPRHSIFVKPPKQIVKKWNTPKYVGTTISKQGEKVISLLSSCIVCCFVVI